jgi:outer membrane protein TolC
MSDLNAIVAAGWTHEQQNVMVRDPAALPPARLPNLPPPPTVAADSPGPPREVWNLSLNEAVRITLENAKAIRVFTGLSAANSGSTIYDAAIANTVIDQQQARFDPTFAAAQSHTRTENPGLLSTQFSPAPFAIDGVGIDTDHTSVGLNKVNALGGRTNVGLVRDYTELNGASLNLNPEERKALELSYTQPLLQGGGFQFNLAPIVIARLDTERSYFQFKDATQELVRGTIEAYWNLVLARVQSWAAEIQVEQAEEAYKIADARLKAGIGEKGNEAQAKVTLSQFRASLIAARANVLDREAALRNVIGLPPADGKEIVPVSAPANMRLRPDWDALLRFAEQRRPDIIELKLVLEADAQRKIQAENAALPQLDANVLYRWNGLSGRLPTTGERISSDPGQFTDWSVGINFSVPLGLRNGRAQVRQQDLIILRDRANLDQGLHAAGHDLAITTRGLESSFEQYLVYRDTRAAALDNVLVQMANWKTGRPVLYLNVLQALNDWGAAINSEARTLIDYNVLLANLERQTGTILETHGLVFVEERFRAAGPLCLPGHERMYSRDFKPSGEPTKYPGSGQPGENTFDLKKPTDKPAELKKPLPVDKKDLPSPPAEKKVPPPPEPKFGEER